MIRPQPLFIIVGTTGFQVPVKLQSLVSQVFNGFWHNPPSLIWGAGDVGEVGTLSLCAVAS